jgi:arsenate reductase (thioredoxin)
MHMLNVLFLCTGNSCRSIMAEALLKQLGKRRFRAFSAGSFPTGKVHPMSLATLKRHGIEAFGFESKSWDGFRNLVELDIVITVCDNAAGEVCPIFPGSPVKAHWGVPDPAHYQGTPEQVEEEFDRVYGMLERRIRALLQLPDGINPADFSQRLDEIGNMA